MVDHLISPPAGPAIWRPSKNTKPERLLRAELRLLGRTGYRLHPRIPGRPDVAFTRWKVAVFTDGRFGTGIPDHVRDDASQYWRTKIARTQERDRAADAELAATGWQVVRIWDFEVLADPAGVAQLVAKSLADAGRISQRPQAPRDGLTPDSLVNSLQGVHAGSQYRE